MKSFEQIAQAIYGAYCVKAASLSPQYVIPWDELGQNDRQSWIAAAKQAAAELSSVH